MTLLRLNRDEINKYIETMEKEVINIKRSALSFSWHSRGGVSYIDALNMSSEERTLMNELIEERFEVVKSTQLPYF